MKVNTKTYQEIKQLLSEAGLKATHPRIVVMSELMGTEQHPTAEQLHDSIKENNPSVSLGTVYRILDDLAEAELIRRVATRRGSKRYDARMEPHSHIYSVNTEEILDYFDEELNEMIKDYFARKKISNFKITDIKLQINGEKLNPKTHITII